MKATRFAPLLLLGSLWAMGACYVDENKPHPNRIQPCLCAPGEKKCENENVMACLNCNWQVFSRCRAKEGLYCNPQSTTCACLTGGSSCFAPGSFRCASGRRERCTRNPLGCAFWQPEPCPSVSPQCVGDGLCCVCQPRASRCTGVSTYQECGQKCLRWFDDTCARMSGQPPHPPGRCYNNQCRP